MTTENPTILVAHVKRGDQFVHPETGAVCWKAIADARQPFGSDGPTDIDVQVEPDGALVTRTFDAGHELPIRRADA